MWNTIKQSLYRFMYGRYGTDSLNTFILSSALVLALLNMFFFDNGIVNVSVTIILFIYIFRSYSRNIYKRRSENDKFMQLIRPFRKRANLAKKQAKDKDHRYFVCPGCKQNVRVPKGRGKIVITCPTCREKFERKS